MWGRRKYLLTSSESFAILYVRSKTYRRCGHEEEV